MWPLIANAQSLVTCGTGGADPCRFSEFLPFLAHLIDFIVKYIAFPLTVLGIAVSGAMFIIGSASEGTRTKAKDALKASIIGFVITLTAWLIVHSILYYLGADSAFKNPLSK